MNANTQTAHAAEFGPLAVLMALLAVFSVVALEGTPLWPLPSLLIEVMAVLLVWRGVYPTRRRTCSVIATLLMTYFVTVVWQAHFR